MNPETGARLRSLYGSAGGVSAVFSSKVADYIKSRPGYPRELFEWLVSRCQPGQDTLVADVGAGTGLLTRGLLQHGYQVVAVEPNAGMRSAADEILGNISGYCSVAGTAEELPLPPASVQLITAAQAFHWFDVERSRAEFRRVLKPGGLVAWIWNDRLIQDPLQAALDQVFVRFGGEKRHALAAHELTRDPLPFFGHEPERFTCPNEHRIDLQGLISFMLSRSYMPSRDSGPGQEVIRAVEQIFGQFEEHGQVLIRYRTGAMMGTLDQA